MSPNTKDTDISSLRIKRDDPETSPPPTTGRSRLLMLLGVLAVVLAFGSWILFGFWESALEVQLVSVSFVSPSQANAVLTASGYVVAQRKAAVASKATGRLVSLGVVEGDRVKRGQVLARIEDADLKAQLDQAQATLRLNEAELRDAMLTLSRQRALLEKDLTAQAEYDAAETRYERVVASIEVAKASVAAAEVALENTLIRAPFDGTVLTKNADVGEMVAPMAASMGARSAVVTIADMSSLEVETDVSESNIQRITEKQPCEIVLDAYPDTRYRGFVTKVVPTADRAKATVLVKVGFRSYDQRVLPEMSAKVTFLSREAEATASTTKSILSIPMSAVAERDGEKVAYMVRNGVAQRVSLQLGATVGSMVEVTQGLSAGEKVIARVDDRIHDGVKVVVK